MRPVTPSHLKHITYDAFNTLRIVKHNAQEAVIDQATGLFHATTHRHG